MKACMKRFHVVVKYIFKFYWISFPDVKKKKEKGHTFSANNPLTGMPIELIPAKRWKEI